MGSNPSQRKTREAILAAPLAHYLEWRLIVACDHCQEHHAFETGRMIAERPSLATARVGTVLRRLKCRACGQVPTAVLLRHRLRDVPLLGPGAFG